ncbi:chemotaxis protein CheA [Sphingomonas desiccabilis]|uniref:Chemotaxis protein CheA n=1 Tax=Sphingomonas desiccabilis TaxID=429134 RepID=A0A4Q2IVF9_9SPHN|nr:chemotaxis protein CheW [Sphingomonas desiccabilis]MBB3909870.1 two-component system chemotaxis sensor kinase CheA [Sphingomonas desiccabilis]RXZ34545.1 chemotaxis protein CheA [Sphingomonas desiccabilis]
MDDLLREFIAETRETLEALSGEIVAWEATPGDRARLDAIFRFVHTVKGSCGFLGLPRLQRLSHAAEDVLADVRAGTRTPDRALVNAVLALVDRIGVLVEALDAGTILPETDEDGLIAALAPGAPEVVPLPQASPRRGPRTVRLGVDLLDRMMAGMSDMVLARNELARLLRQGNAGPGVEAALARLSLSIAEMRDAVTRTRMQKIETLFAGVPRLVRDTAAELGKSVTLTLEGSDVEVDRDMVEVMRDPLVHMVRNAIDHGIENAAERRAAGKPEAGQLTIAARQAGNQIVLEVCDDGRGIDVDRLVEKLAASGTRCEAQLRKLDAAAGADLIFEPGLSVRDVATPISGRGVGMDVVRSAVDRIGGRIELDNRPGCGLRIQIHAPLTLSIIPAILVAVGEQCFAVPRQIVEEIVVGPRARVQDDDGLDMVQVRTRRMPLVALASVLDLPPPRAEPQTLVVVSAPGGCFALAVDGVLDQQELVVKPASPPVMATGLYAGTTLPDSGKPMLLLDCAGIASAAGVRFARVPGPRLGDPDPGEENAREDGPPALVFVDLDGVRRVVPLAAVDRIQQARGNAIDDTQGRLRLLLDGKWLAAEAVAPVGDCGELTVLRLTNGRQELAYAARHAVDIVHLPGTMEAAGTAGRIAGTVLLNKQRVELIDVEWLLGRLEPATPSRPRGGPLCLLAAPAYGPLAAFVGPLLEQHGYRVALGRASWERPAVVLMTEAAAHAATASDRRGEPPVIRLRNLPEPAGPGDTSIYRYDSDALLAAIANYTRAPGALQ